MPVGAHGYTANQENKKQQVINPLSKILSADEQEVRMSGSLAYTLSKMYIAYSLSFHPT